ncbi:MAG: sigma-70 family RNA polymerase sigma factor [Pyrinomonadaceae bacterium]
MSIGEPIALRVQVDIEQGATAALSESRANGEEHFVDRLRNGEAAAFDHLVHERSGDIYALMFRLTQDPEEARDLTQETFLQAFRSVRQFRGDASIRTWLYRIAINLARNKWRWWNRRRRDVTDSLDGDAESYDRFSRQLSDARQKDPEQTAIIREQEQLLRTALAKLRRPFREVVVLRDVEGLSYEEVAQTLSLSVGTVKSRLARGRTQLRRILEGLW